VLFLLLNDIFKRRDKQNRRGSLSLFDIEEDEVPDRHTWTIRPCNIDAIKSASKEIDVT
jgi:hypothetical protein